MVTDGPKKFLEEAKEIKEEEDQERREQRGTDTLMDLSACVRACVFVHVYVCVCVCVRLFHCCHLKMHRRPAFGIIRCQLLFN